MTRYVRSLFLMTGFVTLAGACGGDDGPADAAPPDAPPGMGSLSLSWQLTDGVGPLTCEQVAARSVRVAVTPSIGGIGENDSFGCEVGMAETRAFKTGTYDIEVQLAALAGDLTEAMIMREVEIVTDQVTDLGQMTFQVEPQGGMEFTVSTSASAVNCAPLAQGGAALDNLIFEIRDAQGECIPATLEIGAGGGIGASTYATCMGQVHGCVEKDQVITVSGLPSGSKSLYIYGTRGGVGSGEGCYERTSQFVVPGANLTVELLSQSLQLVPPVNCPM